jgi:thiamine pyrophosphokinase
MSRAVIFANGLIADIESARRLLREDDFLIAADGGTRHLLRLGLIPSFIIGDLDSLNETEQKKVTTGGARVIRHPQDKNETDFELAIHFALKEGYREILVIGALGGRLDQILGNLSVLTSPEFADLDLRVDDGLEEARFTRGRLEVNGTPGDTVSLLPWGGVVIGITTTGLRWPLKDETLFADKTRGISNELLDPLALISIRTGLLLVIRRRKTHPQI